MKAKQIAHAISALCIATGGLTAAQHSGAQEGNWTPMLDQGTQEISIAGRLEFPDFEELNYDLEGSYGYFLRDGWEIGAQIGAADFGGVDRVDVGVFTEYNFNRDSRWVPYLGAAIGLGSVSFDDGDFDTETDLDDDEGAIFDLEAGVKWFVRPYMAISTAINFQLATDDVFATDNSLDDNLTTLQIGMRFYY